MTVRDASRWRPTLAQVRATAVAIVLAAFAVVTRRPDLLVIAVPFGAAAFHATASRPRRRPGWSDAVGRTVLNEGDANRWRGVVQVDEGCRLVTAALQRERWLGFRPEAAAIASVPVDGRAEVEVAFRAVRWGRRSVGPANLTMTDGWGAFRSTATTAFHQVTCLPIPAAFDHTAPVRPSAGLVGQYRASRRGDGGEFAAVRSFQAGDRLRRINWPRSLRTDELQVNATWADQDTHVALVLDASDDIGIDDRSELPPSSLDTGVRAAAAIASHATHRGDRVSLFVFGIPTPKLVPAAAGKAHARRIIGVLADVRPGGGRNAPAAAATVPGLTESSMVVVLSPMATRDALDRAASIGRRGHTVVVIDTLPDEVDLGDDPATALAWRIRRLQRRTEIRRIQQLGVPVVQWVGVGSLDQFLRDTARRSRMPRMRAR